MNGDDIGLIVLTLFTIGIGLFWGIMTVAFLMAFWVRW